MTVEIPAKNDNASGSPMEYIVGDIYVVSNNFCIEKVWQSFKYS